MTANPDIEYTFLVSLDFLTLPIQGAEAMITRFIPLHNRVAEWLYANLDPDTGGFDTNSNSAVFNGERYYRHVVFLHDQDVLAFKLLFGNFIIKSDARFSINL